MARQRANTGSPKDTETIRSSVRKRIPRLPYDSDHQTQKRTHTTTVINEEMMDS